MLCPQSIPAVELYWENAQAVVPEEGYFFDAQKSSNTIVVFWEEFRETGEEQGQLYISLATSKNGSTWEKEQRAIGPFPYTGNRVKIYSAAVHDDGTIYIAVSTGENEITIYSGNTQLEGFSEFAIINTEYTTVTPKLFISSNDELLLFMNQIVTAEDETAGEETPEGEEASGESDMAGEGPAGLSGVEFQAKRETFTIYHTIIGKNGETSAVKPFLTNLNSPLSFLPNHTVHNGKDYVVFQALRVEETRQSYQLYMKSSDDGGINWEEAAWLTDFEEPRPNRENQPGNPIRYDNQRPNLGVIQNKLAVTWERRYGADSPQIYYATLEESGKEIEDYEQITRGVAAARSPKLIEYKAIPTVTWFDNRKGDNHVILATRERLVWNDRDMTQMSGQSVFGQPIVLNNELYLFWENEYAGTTRIYSLIPDRTVPKPVLRGANFQSGGRATRRNVNINWTVPSDSSGIAAFNYAWNRKEEYVPEKRMRYLDNVDSAFFIADEDGTWYFHIIARDYAGNWSEPATLSYTRDTTPPSPVEFSKMKEGKNGFLSSNTFTINWNPPESEDLAGYTYNLEYIGQPERVRGETVSLENPPSRIITDETSKRYVNLDNGVWAFSVAPIDDLGNMGAEKTYVFKLNKYIPVTYISYVDAQKDELGRVTLNIYGRGFTESGRVTEVFLDKDGRRPYDYSFKLDSNAYTVRNDRFIAGPVLTNIYEGTYIVGVVHPERGTKTTRPILTLEPSGTVKYGDFAIETPSTLKPVGPITYSISTNMVLVYVIVILLGLGCVFLVKRLAGLVQEGRVLQMEVQALITGDVMPKEKKKERLSRLRSRGLSLRLKFVLLIILLVFSVVLMISLPLGVYMIDTQRNTLAEGLRNKSEVLLESLATGARSYLPSETTLELGLLPNQITAMEEAVYATITGKGRNDPDNFNYVWASNDEDITEKIDTEELLAGESRITDNLTPKVQDLKQQINEKAKEEVQSLADEIETLGNEARKYALQTGEEAQAQLEELQLTINVLNSRLKERLNEISKQVYSYPEYSPDSLSEDQTIYIFYKPIVYRRAGDNSYYRGLVRLGISVEGILKEIENSRQILIRTTLVFASIAIGLGILGALLLATITVGPIKLLVKGVATIRDTEDLTKLKGHRIDVRTRDELAMLADTVNQMTQGLVEAAVANQDLIVGKSVQKMFIPLETTASGRKLTTGSRQEDNIEFYGYYEGAKGVSGDYYHYTKLDQDRWAVVKCDIAGKGVPAALIMVQLATIFLDYFKDWYYKRDGIHLDQLVYRINDLLEERGFKGRFAAFTVSIINAKTGTCHFCNAGDNILHYYDSTERKSKQKVFSETPAAGVFPSDLVEMKNGFQQEVMKLNKGDVLFMFTDGLEEAKRIFRNENFESVSCEEPNLEKNELHGNHYVGAGDEELGIPRIYDVINAVFNGDTYTLEKYHNPLGEEKLTFDFTTCEGTIEEAVLAVMSLERVFRVYPDPSATEEDIITVDKKIDDFLKEHFDQYHDYFVYSKEHEEFPEYIYYTHLKEDEQFDDLTILAIKKR